MLSLHCSSRSEASAARRRADLAPISVGQISLQNRVAEMMIQAHKISRELADYHVARMKIEELVSRFRFYAEMELTVAEGAERRCHHEAI